MQHNSAAAREALRPDDESEVQGLVSLDAMIRSVIVEKHDLRCRAEHPGKPDRFRGRLHLARVGIAPFRVRPTGRVLADESEIRDGHIPAYCGECKLFTEYEVVAP